MIPKKTFSERVVELVLSVPKGRVTTYGDLARAAGAGPMAAQSITTILWRAEQAGVKNIPYHRIVYAGGKAWLNEECKKERLELYAKEGIEVSEKGVISGFEDIRV